MKKRSSSFMIAVGYLGWILLLAGCGSSDDGPTSPWTKLPSSGGPSARQSHSAILDTDGNMIVFGGDVDRGDSWTSNPKTWNYKLSAHAWSPITIGPGGPNSRWGHTAVYDGVGKMYIFGGAHDISYALTFKDVWEYDLSEQTWKELNSSSGPSERWWHSAVYYDGEMIILDGIHEGHDIDEIWSYNIATENWIPLHSTKGPEARDNFSAISDGNGNIIVFGGMTNPTDADPDSIFFNDVWSYSIKNERWTPLASSGAPEKRSMHSAVLDGDDMIIFGGIDGTTPLSDVWSYDLTTQKWTELDSHGGPSARFSHTAVMDRADGDMIIFGGSGPLDEVWAYSLR